MKKYLFGMVALMALVLTACSYDDSELWDKVNDLDNRVKTLEGLCREMNTNIESLETILESLNENEHVSNIAPITEDGEVVGYTITFTSGESVTIYNNNEAGGTTPSLGVAKDEDGLYYWTLDGEWLLDNAGNKVKAEGTDGLTPRLKVEDGYWYVSYDNGATWVEAGAATTEGSGDNLFKEVSYDDEYVYLTLADGTVLVLPRTKVETPEEPETGNSGNAIDLGLSVKWADRNVGAESPEAYGEYYAWGELTSKTDYNEWNCVSYGKETGVISGNATYDVATANWGDGWRLPTVDEINELMEKCTFSWVEQNGVGGTLVEGNGNSIFLPATGYYKETAVKYEGTYGTYWTGTPNDSWNYQASSFDFYDAQQAVYWDYRFNGHVVRPVKE